MLTRTRVAADLHFPQTFGVNGLSTSLDGRRGPLRRAARYLAPLAFDSAALIAGLSTAVLLRYEGQNSLIDSGGLARVLLVTVVTQWAVAAALRFSGRRYGTGSVDGVVESAASWVLDTRHRLSARHVEFL